MEEHRMAHAVCFRLLLMGYCSTAVQELSEVSAGVRSREIMTSTSSGDSALPASCVTVAIQMVTAAIFLSYMAGKCTQRAPLRMKPSPGAPQHTTMTPTNSGVIVEVKNIYMQLLPDCWEIFIKFDDAGQFDDSIPAFFVVTFVCFMQCCGCCCSSPYFLTQEALIYSASFFPQLMHKCSLSYIIFGKVQILQLLVASCNSNWPRSWLKQRY